MGTITETKIAGYGIHWTKNHLDPVAMTIFRESDRKESGRGHRKRVVYKASAATVAQRLDVMGFTLERCKQEYEHGRAEELSQFDESATSKDADFDNWLREKYETLKELTFDVYCDGLAEVIRHRLYSYTEKKPADLSEAASYILESHDEFHLGFFADDVRLLLRVACSVVKPGAEVTQDVSALISSGWIDGTTPCCDDAVDSLTRDYPANAPQILLIEGSTDADILRASLELMFPHMVGYFTFFDFASTRAAGGAGQVVSTLKAFAAAGVTNRVVALLDNDTVAHEAVRAIRGSTLPSNMRLLHYPAMPMLKSYPTIGPSGPQRADVNGTAGSIELYVGKDILRPDKALFPVQWRGYVPVLARYQGEVMGKDKIMEAWAAKVRAARKGSRKELDFSGVTAIWESIFRAFR